MYKCGKIYTYNMKKIGVSMGIIGAVLFMVLPYAAGYGCKRILRWRETNQIETYLIGFFFLFFLQGVILVPCVWLEKSLTTAGSILLTVIGLLILVAGVFAGFPFISTKREEVKEKDRRLPWKKIEKKLFFVVLALFFVLLLRLVLSMGILREDSVLETVLTTIQTDSLFKYHPLTGGIMEAGMISSKKIVTLPLFYACITWATGMDEAVFLYLVMGVMVLLCSYFATTLLFAKVSMPTKGKLFFYWLIYTLLLLSGDYHTDTLAYRLLYRGYEGTTICFGVILPYLLYLIVSWYKLESGEETVMLATRIMYILKMMLGFAVSVVITGLGTGFVFLFMAVVVAGICCILKSIKEVRACRE